MSSKKKESHAVTLKERKALGTPPNQSRPPGEIQGFSKHLKKNKGQGRGQRNKAH